MTYLVLICARRLHRTEHDGVSYALSQIRVNAVLWLWPSVGASCLAGLYRELEKGIRKRK